MKWVLVFLTVFLLVALVMEGEDPHVAIIGNDAKANAFKLYFSPKHLQFLYDHIGFGVPQCFGTISVYNQYLRLGGLLSRCEFFFAQAPTNQQEVCHVGIDLSDSLTADRFVTLSDAKTPGVTRASTNAGSVFS